MTTRGGVLFISGRKKGSGHVKYPTMADSFGSQASAMLQGVYPSMSATVTIKNFPEIVNISFQNRSEKFIIIEILC